MREWFWIAGFILGGPLLAQAPGTPEFQRSYPCGSRAATEDFLRTARVVGIKHLGTGVTRRRKIALHDGKLRHYGIFKLIDLRKPGVTNVEGMPEYDFKDSRKYEVTACELDKLLGMGMVPATVARTLDRKQGSLQI